MSLNAIKSLVLVILLVVAVMAAAGGGLVGAQGNTPCYGEQGGAKHVAASGCEYEFRSGATVDVQSGVTYSNAANVTQSGPLTVSNNLIVTGTSDLQGNVSDSGGDLTIADNAAITGTLDVQGGDITLENDETIGNSTDGTIALGGAVDVTGASLQYGPNDLYPVGSADSGFVMKWGNSTVTGSAVVTPTGVSALTNVICTVGADSTAANATCTAAINSGTGIVLKVWAADGTTPGNAGTLVYYQALGTP